MEQSIHPVHAPQARPADLPGLQHHNRKRKGAAFVETIENVQAENHPTEVLSLPNMPVASVGNDEPGSQIDLIG